MSSDTKKPEYKIVSGFIRRPIRRFLNTSFYHRIFFSSSFNRFHSAISNKARLLWLNVEFTSFCNIRCRMCSLDHSAPQGFMGKNTLEKILEEIVSSKFIKVSNLALWYGGETLLHPHLEDMLKMISLFKKREYIFPYVTLLTNGVLLKGKKLDSILNSGAVDLLLVSIDGGTKESFEYWRNGANWENVLHNVNRTVDKIKEKGLNLRTGLVSIIENPDKISEEFSRLIKKTDVYLPRTFHHWDGNSKIVAAKNTKVRNGLCYTVTRQLAVHWDGNVSPCCMDLNQRGTIGNVNKKSIYEIFNSPERLKIISEMEKMKRQNIDLCRHCSN